MTGTKMAMLVPSRNRPQNVKPLVEACRKTDPYGRCELRWILDADDPCYQDYLAELGSCGGHRGMWVNLVSEWKPTMHKLNDVAVELATARVEHDVTAIDEDPRVTATLPGRFIYQYLGFMGDDHLPRTQGWAQRVASALYTSPMGILYGRDGLKDKQLPTWWMMSADVVRRLGRMVPAPVEHLYADNAVYELGRRAGCLVYADDLLIEHMHPLAEKAEMDDGYLWANAPERYQSDGAIYQRWKREQLPTDVQAITGE